MTVTNHALQGFVFVNVLLRSWNKFDERTNNIISGVFGVAGMLPDIVPACEILKGNYNSLYVVWHDVSWRSLIPTIGLHQIEDFLLHSPGGGWAWYAYPIEVMTAAAIFLYFALAYKDIWTWIVGSAFVVTWILGIIKEHLIG